MPSFEFTDIATALKLSEANKDSKMVQQGSMSFTVRNTAPRSLVGRLSVRSGGASAAAPEGWFAFDGSPPTNAAERELEFAASTTQTAKLTVTVPAGTSGGQRLFAIRISAENDPDNDYRDSPAVAFNVPPPKTVPLPPPPKFPWWIVALVAGVLIVGGLGAYFALQPSAPKTVPADIIGARSDAAAQELIGMGLAVAFAYQANPAAIGTVLSSSPPPGHAPAADKTVTLTISQGQSPINPCRVFLPGCRPLRTLSDLNQIMPHLANPQAGK